MTTEFLRPPFDAQARARIARALAGGAVMTYPTETSYALGGNALDGGLCARIVELKGRPGAKALLSLIEGEAMADALAAEIAPAARVLMERFWPGALTLVFRAAPGAPERLRDARGTIALRWSSHPAVRELIGIGGVPLIGTSANLSGAEPLHDARAAAEAFPGAVELAIDDGPAPGGAPSTVVDTTVAPFRVLREGNLAKSLIQAALVETFVELVPE